MDFYAGRTLSPHPPPHPSAGIGAQIKKLREPRLSFNPPCVFIDPGAFTLSAKCCYSINYTHFSRAFPESECKDKTSPRQI
jgi:hypothetical protein